MGFAEKGDEIGASWTRTQGGVVVSAGGRNGPFALFDGGQMHSSACSGISTAGVSRPLFELLLRRRVANVRAIVSLRISYPSTCPCTIGCRNPGREAFKNSSSRRICAEMGKPPRRQVESVARVGQRQEDARTMAKMPQEIDRIAGKAVQARGDERSMVVAIDARHATTGRYLELRRNDEKGPRDHQGQAQFAVTARSARSAGRDTRLSAGARQQAMQNAAPTESIF